MRKFTSNQNDMNQLIATAINSDKRTAFMNATNVKRRLTVPVTDELFMSLVTVCHKVGIDAFGNSVLLQMVNTKHSNTSVKAYISMMLNKE